MNKQIQNKCVDRTGSFLSPVLTDISVLHPAVKSWRTTVSSQPPESCKQRRHQVRQVRQLFKTMSCLFMWRKINLNIPFQSFLIQPYLICFIHLMVKKEKLHPSVFARLTPNIFILKKSRNDKSLRENRMNQQHVDINCFKTNNGRCTQRKSGASISFKTNHGQKIGVCFYTL